ncbi:MAG: tetratricopeptide repeat protein, partial [Phycisphaerales bacterium]|nr:tetratricopeptide repeat protein [Phycisphaerales bacterium]
TEEVPFSALSWRTLGLVHNFNQNYKDALNSFNEAYSLSPDDVENIRRYIGAMLQTEADPQRIMRVMHLALETFPRNTQLQDMWLGLEMRFGDQSKVLGYRLDRYNREPEDRLNALQLALLLVNTQPEMVYIYNPDGSKAYSKNEWLLLTKTQRRELLSALQTDWEDKVETILDSASNEADPDIQTAIIHASIERDRGRLNAASLILDKFIDERIGSESYTKSVIAVANFLQAAQRYVQARTILEAAMDVQGEDMEISAALGSLLLSSTLSADQVRAAEVLSDAAKASGNPIIYSRWINSLIVIGKFDEAEAALEGFKGTNDEYTKAMLQSLVHRRKSEIQLAQGKTQLARGELEKYRSALSRAITADEENPIPYIQLCRSLISEYSLTQNASLLEEALEYSDRGSSFNETNEEFAIVRTDVLQADGQLRRAIESLDSFLTKVPSANEVRQKLIEAHLDADDLEKAITVTTAGVAVDPSSATWHRRLGDLLVRASDDREEAILSYLRALELEPSTQLLFLINNISRTDQPLPYQQLLKMARGEVSMQHPVVKTIEAKALLGLGQKRDAERTMALAWASFENAIASGWITPSSLSIWFADLTVIFADDPPAGEQFALQLIGSDNSPEATIGLAGYWWELDRKHIERSLVLLDEVIDDPEVVGDSRIGALMRKGAFLVEAERYEEGVRMFEQLNEENPNNPLILNNLSYVVGVYLNKPSEGLELAMEAVEISPNHPAIIDTVSKLYELMGENQKAVETLDFLLQIDPVNAKAMARLALLFAGPLNKPERAVTIANRARSQQPRSPEALDALGWSYIQSGQLAKGERFLKRSLANGETPMAYIHMAQLVMKEGKFDEAIGHLRIAEELSKDQHTLGRINSLRDDIRKTQTAVN